MNTRVSSKNLQNVLILRERSDPISALRTHHVYSTHAIFLLRCLGPCEAYNRALFKILGLPGHVVGTPVKRGNNIYIYCYVNNAMDCSERTARPLYIIKRRHTRARCRSLLQRAVVIPNTSFQCAVTREIPSLKSDMSSARSCFPVHWTMPFLSTP